MYVISSRFFLLNPYHQKKKRWLTGRESFVICNDGYTIERYIHGWNESYNDIQPWKFVDLPVAFGGQRGEYSTHQIKTRKDLLDLFANEAFSSPECLQVSSSPSEALSMGQSFGSLFLARRIACASRWRPIGAEVYSGRFGEEEFKIMTIWLWLWWWWCATFSCLLLRKIVIADNHNHNNCWSTNANHTYIDSLTASFRHALYYDLERKNTCSVFPVHRSLFYYFFVLLDEKTQSSI